MSLEVAAARTGISVGALKVRAHRAYVALKKILVQMTEARQITHEERHRTLVERLAADLKPVRRLWPVRVRLGLWLVVQAALLAWVASHTPNDFMRKLEAPRYLLEVALFAGAAILAAIIALRSAIPGRPVRTSELVITLVLLMAGTGLVMTQPLRTGYPLSEFIRVGRFCAMQTCVLAAMPWIALWWAVKRGAPMRAGAAGLAVAPRPRCSVLP